MIKKFYQNSLTYKNNVIPTSQKVFIEHFVLRMKNSNQKDIYDLPKHII
jgi:hypothetical protein